MALQRWGPRQYGDAVGLFSLLLQDLVFSGLKKSSLIQIHNLISEIVLKLVSRRPTLDSLLLRITRIIIEIDAYIDDCTV